MAVLSGLLTLIGQLTRVWQSVATPSGLLAVGALVLAGLLALAVALAATPVGHTWWLWLQGSPHALADWFQGLFT